MDGLDQEQLLVTMRMQLFGCWLWCSTCTPPRTAATDGENATPQLASKCPKGLIDGWTMTDPALKSTLSKSKNPQDQSP
jgi:hypothetical protein